MSNDISAACAGAFQQKPQPLLAPKRSVESRLAELSELREKGLIDVDEYASRRREILNDV